MHPYPLSKWLLLLVASSLIILLPSSNNNNLASAGVPSEPLYFDRQIVNHLSNSNSNSNSNNSNSDSNNTKSNKSYWRQRYYADGTHFKGPGSPIFLIMGGESSIEPSTGLYYPFVVNVLAEKFGAFVIQPEHRFYGESQPLRPYDYHDGDYDASLWKELFTSEQAMWDAVTLVQHLQTKLNCTVTNSNHIYTHTHTHHCPVITVGGSYPGFLAMAMRIVHPDVISMAYSASAPIKFYSQSVGQYEYYDHIAKVADMASPGCRDDVREVLVEDLFPLFDTFIDHHNGDDHNDNHDDFQELLRELGVCDNTVPKYILDGSEGTSTDTVKNVFYRELMMVVAYTFANYNMAYYPPNERDSSHRPSLVEACRIFQNTRLRPIDRLRSFLVTIPGANSPNSNKEDDDDDSSTNEYCFNMTSQLPYGHDATISSGDWSGVGTGRNGLNWDFQTCTLLVEHIGFGPDSMFPTRPWTYDWLADHCMDRFDVMPEPFELVDGWKFDDLLSINASYILFTNGMKDGWSVGGMTRNLSENILALNFENGAHHSDLSGVGPSEDDTWDIKEGFVRIEEIIGTWLDEIRLGSKGDDSDSGSLESSSSDGDSYSGGGIDRISGNVSIATS